MNIFTRVKEFIMNLFKTSAEKEFNVDIIDSDLMEIAQSEWRQIIQGIPSWVSDSVSTINFAKFLCYYTSKKTCLELNATVSGSERADYIDKCIKAMIKKSIRDKVEDACGCGGIILKPTGTYNPNSAIDYVMPDGFAVTEKNSNGDILGCIFIDHVTKGDQYYTRLEYHHFTSSEVEGCYPAFYLVLNHPTFNQIKKKHGINYSDKFYIRLLYAVFFVLSYSLPHKKIAGLTLEKSGLLLLTHR